MIQVRESFKNLSSVLKDCWEDHERDLVEQQPVIQKRLIDALWKYSSIPYDGIVNSIHPWCSVSTIRWWVMPREGFTMYLEFFYIYTLSYLEKTI